MDSIQQRIDTFLMVEVATFERENRGRRYTDLKAARNAMAHKWDSLCRELLKPIPHGAYRNEVESRLVAAADVVTEWWDHGSGSNVTANDLTDFIDRLRGHADAVRRLVELVPTVAANDDDSVYRPAWELRRQRSNEIPTAAACNKFLKDHPEIRKRNPTKNRLEIHAGDWLAYWSDYDGKQFDALDSDAIVKGIEEQKTTERARKGKKTSRAVPI